MKHKSIMLWFVYGWMIIFGFMPLCLLVITSFLSENRESLVALPWTLANYQAIFSHLVAHVVLRSVGMAALTTVSCLLLAYPFSYIMVKAKHQSLLVLLIIIPFWTSSLIRTYALIAILKLHGLLNQLLMFLNLVDHPLSLLYSNAAVIVGLIYTLFPFMVLPIFNQMQRFDFRLFDAARDLGANKLALFFRVFLPNTMPGVTAGSLLVFLPAMTLFYIPNVLGGAQSILLGNLIQNQFFVAENWPEGAATSLLLTGLLIVLFILSRNSKGKIL